MFFGVGHDQFSIREKCTRKKDEIQQKLAAIRNQIERLDDTEENLDQLENQSLVLSGVENTIGKLETVTEKARFNK